MDPLTNPSGCHWNHYSLEDFNLNPNIYKHFLEGAEYSKVRHTDMGRGEEGGREIHVVMAMDKHCPAHTCTSACYTRMSVNGTPCENTGFFLLMEVI
jgi:hypothetical protein